MGLVAARRCSWHEAAGRIAWAEILLLSGPINWLEVDFACTSNFMRVSYVNCTVDGEGRGGGRSVILCRLRRKFSRVSLQSYETKYDLDYSFKLGRRSVEFS